MPSWAFHQDNPPPISFAWQLGISCDFCCFFFVMSRWACRNTTRCWSMLSWTPSNKKSRRGDTAVTSRDFRSGLQLKVIPVVILDRWAKHQEGWRRKWFDERIVDHFHIISFLFDLKQAVQKTRAAEIIGCIVDCSSSRWWRHFLPGPNTGVRCLHVVNQQTPRRHWKVLVVEIEMSSMLATEIRLESRIFGGVPPDTLSWG